MNLLDVAPEVAESCLEIAIALSKAANGRSELLRAAAFVHRCYVRALAPAPSRIAHHLRWRRFIASLDAYLDRCTPCAQTHKLRGIVAENQDLLEVQPALAS